MGGASLTTPGLCEDPVRAPGMAGVCRGVHASQEARAAWPAPEMATEATLAAGGQWLGTASSNLSEGAELRLGVGDTTLGRPHGCPVSRAEQSAVCSFRAGTRPAAGLGVLGLCHGGVSSLSQAPQHPQALSSSHARRAQPPWPPRPREWGAGCRCNPPCPGQDVGSSHGPQRPEVAQDSWRRHCLPDRLGL